MLAKAESLFPKTNLSSSLARPILPADVTHPHQQFFQLPDFPSPRSSARFQKFAFYRTNFNYNIGFQFESKTSWCLSLCGDSIVSSKCRNILGALCPSKSGLMNKHIVKHSISFLVPCARHKHIVKPSKSGLMNKHIVKHILGTGNLESARPVLWVLQG